MRGILGIAVILAICWLLSRNRRAIPYRVVVSGIFLQVVLGLLVFKTSVGQSVVQGLSDFFRRVLEFSYEGSSFVFGPLGTRDGLASEPGASFLAFQALPIVIYFSALTAGLYHFGILQAVVYAFARVLGKLLRVSGAESMVVAANVFVGMTEAPLVVRPYIERMTRSELMALMTGGFATVAGTVLGVYMVFVGETYAPYLIAASVMSAPAAFVTAKILVPETEVPATGGHLKFTLDRPGSNFLDAISIGVRDGLKLALNIAAMLIAFYALIALVNWPLRSILDVEIQDVFGWLLRPLAWCLGVEWEDSSHFGSLLGTKVAINEWIGFQSLQEMIRTQAMSERSIKIATFALCGFANFGSVGITLGALGQLAPGRRIDFARFALLAMVGGALSSFLTAAIAGLFL